MDSSSSSGLKGHFLLKCSDTEMSRGGDRV